MRLKPLAFAGVALGLTGLAALPAWAQTVKITPLGSHEGDFCRYDRAMVFEDPDGTRILYDAGRTVRGPDDPRLGDIDAVILSHVHGDHLGDRIPAAAGAGSCASPEFGEVVAPTSNSVNIVVGKNARFLVGAEMASFFGPKVAGAGGNADQVQLIRYGASRQVGGVSVTTVPAVHSNGLNPAFLEGGLGNQLKAANLTAYIGPPSGYVLSFSNGVVAYLSGDTGITAEQDLVVRGHYGANLAVMNIGDVFTTGPTEAAYVVNTLVRPRSVIPSHANEEATRNGEVIDGTRTAAFVAASRVPVHLPLSGRTMEFDGTGRCVAGC